MVQFYAEFGAYTDQTAITSWPGGASQHVYVDGSLPYTAQLPVYQSGSGRRTSYNPDDNRDMMKFFYDHLNAFAAIAEKMPKPMEKQFFTLRHGNALLEWADALYRSDEPASIARARELYKAALFLHGTTPPIGPQWPGSLVIHFHFSHHAPNSAVVSQKQRARRGFKQIELGLNYYGVNNDFVPTLRYRALKDAADRFAATAKAAQQDFLVYMGRVEDAIRDGLVTTNMLKKATLQGEIADAQVKIAEFNVMVAKQQVAQVKAAIEAKKKEIQDEDAFNNPRRSGGGHGGCGHGLRRR